MPKSIAAPKRQKSDFAIRRRPPGERRIHLLARIETWDVSISMGPQLLELGCEPWDEGVYLRISAAVVGPSLLPKQLRPFINLAVLSKRDLAKREYRERPDFVGSYRVEKGALDAVVSMETDLVALATQLIERGAVPWISLEITWPEHRGGSVISVSFDRTFEPEDWPDLALADQLEPRGGA